MGRAGDFGQLEPGDPEQVGPYRTVALLGAGGMGRVYLAVSRGGRPVAVKVIRPDIAGDKQFRRRFAREVAASRAVSGVFTAAVVDADTQAALPWCSIASEIISIAMTEGFDDLDAPVLRVTDIDVPLPYAANLEKMALIKASQVVEAVKQVTYR